MSIRAVLESDYEALIPLMLQYIVGFYQRPDPGVVVVRQHIAHLLAQPTAGRQFVAEQDGQLLGFATLYFSFSTLRVQPIAILNDLFVTEAARGQGVGEHLFDFCRTYVQAAGYAYMQWETTKDNYIAQSLYEKKSGKLSDLLVYELDC